MPIDIEDQVGGAESVVSVNASFPLDATARKDNAPPQQNDMAVKRALVGALGASWGDCRKELGRTEPKKRRRQQGRKKWGASRQESAFGRRKRQSNLPTKLLRPVFGNMISGVSRCYPPPHPTSPFCADTSETRSSNGAQCTSLGTVDGSKRPRCEDMIIDIEDQVGGAESVVSVNAPFSLDATARKDNASPQQNDMEVKRALADALDASWGDCRKELGWTEPEKRHR